jgi:putative membrane protein
MLATWALGLWLAWAGSWLSAPWLHAKIVLVLVLSGLHGFAVRWVRDFGQDQNRYSVRFYRIINEVPTVLMVAIVVLAVVKPF